MKIDAITVTLFAREATQEVQYAPGQKFIAAENDLGLLTIRTDAGLEGHAFLGGAIRGGSYDASNLITTLKPMLMGQDPLAREFLFRKMMSAARRTALRCIGAVDVALWDIAGKAANMPIHQLMGTCRKSLPAYVSSPILPGKQAYVEEALAFREKGYTAYKIHPPARWEEDIEVCEAVRKGVGDGYRLMLDSMWSYKYPEAVRVGEAISDLGYYWYEDPLCEDDLSNYVKLRQKVSVPIMATEMSLGAHTSYQPWITTGATDYLRGDVAVKGGLTGCLKAAHLAECFHMNYEIHHGGNSLNNVANLHLAMSIPNTEYFEVLLPDAANKYGLLQEIEADSKGLVHAFDKPGLGAEIDFDLIKRKQFAVLK